MVLHSAKAEIEIGCFAVENCEAIFSDLVSIVPGAGGVQQYTVGGEPGRLGDATRWGKCDTVFFHDGLGVDGCGLRGLDIPIIMVPRDCEFVNPGIAFLDKKF